MYTSWKDPRNLSMLVDFYELTMSNSYFENNLKETEVVFDMYFRKVPDKGGFAIFAGLEQLIDYLENLSFTQEDVDFLKTKNLFSNEFLNYLLNFEFTCDIWAFNEGTPIFPNEPVVIVKGPVIQATLIETMTLLTINHQSLVATKANWIVRAAQGRSVFEFGSRRAQGYDAAIYGARAAYIAGCTASALTMGERDMNIPAVGTMAHSWVQLFESEYEAFKTYATTYPHECTLLVDTYSTLSSGVPNAIKVFDEVVVPAGHRPKGIRIDSGDIAYLSKKCRKMLDDAGYSDVKIIASNSLDEYIIQELLVQKAEVDFFGVGEKLVTSRSEPVFGGVYKLVAVKKGDGFTPKIKISETVEKITTPGFKRLVRIFDKADGHAIADYIMLNGEELDESEPLLLFDPNAVWKKQTITNYFYTDLLVPIFVKGKLVYNVPSLQEVRKNCINAVDTLWDEVKRFEFPHKYYVDLSQKLWQTKQDLLLENNFK